MKQVSLFAILMIIKVSSYGQLFTFSFGNTTSCVTDGNAVTTANATVTSFSRVGGLTCESGNFNNSNWTISASSPTDLSSLTKYIEVTVTPASGFQLSLSMANFFAQKSSTGPTTAWICHNLSGNFNDNKKDFAPATTTITNSANQVNWDFTDFTTTSAVVFRIYGWGLNSSGGGNATSAGTFRIDKFSLAGAVTPVGGNTGNNFTPFTFDQASGLAGLGKTPTQKLDVVGNIRTSGKLLVGDVPDAKISTLTEYSLAVNGQALFTKARVLLQASWPDFVFNDKYALLPLAELENYIKEHQHLPGVLPADEVEKTGVDVAGTQAILLQKIEELTLYIIEQDKKIRKMQEQISNNQQLHAPSIPALQDNLPHR